MGVYIWSRLPSEYQEVEYIESSGSQYINTGYQPNNTTEVECKLNMVSITNVWDSIYGATNTSSGASKRAFLLQIQKSTYKMYATIYSNYGSYQVSISSTSGISTNTDYTIKQTQTNFYINGTSQGTYSSSSYTVGYNMFIFGYSEGGTSTSMVSMKLYSFKIYDNGTLVRNFIPCYRKSDSVIGLYDLVNNQFYTNSGSGTFTKGSDVDTYRESLLKNAYIGEYIPTNGLLGYRPLQSDLKDYSGNGKDGSWYIYSSGSFGTVGGKTGARVTKDSGDSSEHHIVTTLNYSGPTVTMCGWIYYSSIQSSGRRPGVLTNSSSGSSYISLSARPAQSNRWSVGGNSNILTSTTTPSIGTWYFVVGVLTSSGKKIYVNGTQIASDSTGFTSGQGSIWRLGCGQQDADRYGGTDGYIRHCAVYNRELTTDEITKFYTLTS